MASNENHPMPTAASPSRPLQSCPGCSSLLCAHLVCRTCGSCEACDTVQDMEMVRSLFPAPPRETMATTVEALRRMGIAETDLEAPVRAMRELVSDECPCENRKRKFHAFCQQCYRALTPDVQRKLDLHIRNGYLDAYRQALAQLRALGRIAGRRVGGGQ